MGFIWRSGNPSGSQLVLRSSGPSGWMRTVYRPMTPLYSCGQLIACCSDISWTIWHTGRVLYWVNGLWIPKWNFWSLHELFLPPEFCAVPSHAPPSHIAFPPTPFSYRAQFSLNSWSRKEVWVQEEKDTPLLGEVGKWQWLMLHGVSFDFLLSLSIFINHYRK